MVGVAGDLQIPVNEPFMQGEVQRATQNLTADCRLLTANF